MQVEQIVYGSVNGRRMKGYQIIGKSPLIGSVQSAEFCKWAPSHGAIEVASDQDARDAWALSFFPVSDYYHVISRSVHGAVEYSGRGGLSVVTNAIVLSNKDLASYQSHVIDLARTALCLGNLILKSGAKATLPQVTLPQRPLPLPEPKSDFTDSKPARLPEHVSSWISREAADLLRDNRKVTVVGPCDPLPILSGLMDQLDIADRSRFSFACGLKPSSRRNFRLQFTGANLSPKLRKELERAGHTPIDVAGVLVETA